MKTSINKSAMIKIGSKEEVALLLALFGTYTQPTRKPKGK